MPYLPTMDIRRSRSTVVADGDAAATTSVGSADARTFASSFCSGTEW